MFGETGAGLLDTKVTQESLDGHSLNVPMRLVGGGAPDVVTWDRQWVDRKFLEVGQLSNMDFGGPHREREGGDEEDDNRVKRIRAVSPPRPAPAQHPPVSGGPVCQVDGCRADLSGAKDYHRRHKVCEMHSKAATVTLQDLPQRFCQQCSRFHQLSEFDEGKRSCRRRLLGHNRRRRKVQPGADPGADPSKTGAGGGGRATTPPRAGGLSLLSGTDMRGNQGVLSASAAALLSGNHPRSESPLLHQVAREQADQALSGQHTSQGQSANLGILGGSMEEFRKLQAEIAAQGAGSPLHAQNTSQFGILQQMAALQQRQQQQQREREQLLDLQGQGRSGLLSRLFSDDHTNRHLGQRMQGLGDTGLTQAEGQEVLNSLNLGGGHDQGQVGGLSQRTNRDAGLPALTQEQAAALMSGSLGLTTGLATRGLLELLRQRQEQAAEQGTLPNVSGQEGTGGVRPQSLFDVLGQPGGRDGGRSGDGGQQQTSGSQNWHLGF